MRLGIAINCATISHRTSRRRNRWIIMARNRNSASCCDYDIGRELDGAESRYFDPRTKRHRINKRHRRVSAGTESASPGQNSCGGTAAAGDEEDVLR